MAENNPVQIITKYRVILSLEIPTIVYKKLCYWDNNLKIKTENIKTMQNRACWQSMLKLVSFHIQAHLNVFLQILEYFPHICLGLLARESPCIKQQGQTKYQYTISQHFADVANTDLNHSLTSSKHVTRAAGSDVM